MGSQNLKFGKSAEDQAAGFLKTRGYRVLERNYKNKFGEIDIIARHKGAICFVEVKARRCVTSGLPLEAVGLAKQRQISRAAVGYLKSNNLLEKPARFDVLSLLYIQETPQIELIQNAFELPADITI